MLRNCCTYPSVCTCWVAGDGSALGSTYDSAAVGDMLTVVNRIWAQAGIVWELESLIREDALHSAVYDSLLRGEIPRTREPLTGFVPRDSLLTPGWNLFLIRDFGQIAGGVFAPEILGIVLAERGMGYDLPAGGRGGATLAHELGHSLGLAHEPCTSVRNIMANACWRSDLPSALTAEQVGRARRQASLGHPVEHVPQ